MTDRKHPTPRSEAEGQEARRVPVVDKRAASRADAADEMASSHAEVSAVVEAAALAEAEKLAEERLDQLKRLKADFENYRKRVIREQTDLVERASLRIVEQLLPVFDDFERGVAALRTHADPDGAERPPVNEQLVRGLEIVLERLRGVLEQEGLERVQAEGVFDPHEHEAVSSTPGDVNEPTILEVVRPGYRLKGKTIRPALVHVTTPEESDGGHPGANAEGQSHPGANAEGQKE